MVIFRLIGEMILKGKIILMKKVNLKMISKSRNDSNVKDDSKSRILMRKVNLIRKIILNLEK